MNGTAMQAVLWIVAGFFLTAAHSSAAGSASFAAANSETGEQHKTPMAAGPMAEAVRGPNLRSSRCWLSSVTGVSRCRGWRWGVGGWGDRGGVGWGVWWV